MMYRVFAATLLFLLILFCGCVSSIFPGQNSSETPLPTATPAPAPTPVPTIRQNAVSTPTPSPIPVMSPGTAGVGGWISWVSRNASGGSVAMCHYTVYDWKILNGSYHWQSRYSLTNFQQAPPAGMKWIFVWVNGWCDENQVKSQDLPKEFRIWYHVQAISPTIALEGGNGREEIPLLIYETKSHSTLSVIQGYWDGGPKYTTDPYGYRDTISMDTHLSGKSNAWDGWMLFAIPSNASYQDLRISANSKDSGLITWDLSRNT